MSKRIFALLLLMAVIASALATNFFISVAPPIGTYFRDEVVLMGDDLAGEPFVLQVELNRKQVSSLQFIHFYTLSYLSGDRVLTRATDFKDTSPEVQPSGFLKAFHNQIHSDLSTREDYQLQVTFDDFDLSISLADLRGDFITKNTLEYTRYMSEGTARIRFNGESLQAEAMLEKAYSADFSRYVYFDGYDDFNGESQVFTLWDEEGNFYHLDQTNARSFHQGYASHQWIMAKRVADQSRRSAFAMGLDFDWGQKFWTVNVPDLNLDVELFTASDIAPHDRTLGIVEGVVKDEAGERAVKGMFIYDGYKEEAKYMP